jgi:hypothetical protein
MAEPDRRSALLHSHENAAVILSGITVEQVGHPTTRPGLDVARLIDHIVEATYRAPLSAGGRPRRPETTRPTSSYPTRPLSYARRRGSRAGMG